MEGGNLVTQFSFFVVDCDWRTCVLDQLFFSMFRFAADIVFIQRCAFMTVSEFVNMQLTSHFYACDVRIKDVLRAYFL